MGAKNSPIYLSKSLFVRGLQCHKSLHLRLFHPELRDELTEAQEARFQMGTEVGLYARQLFPGGLEIPYDSLSHEEQLQRTNSALAKGVTVLYEPAFSHDGVFVKVDLLHRSRKGWEIYEVKSSTEVKDPHIDDISVQYFVVVGSGLPVSRASVVYINNQYVRGGEIEAKKLFAVQDLTREVQEKQGFVVEEIRKMRTMLQGPVPEIDIGKYCANPYPCDFEGHCWAHIPAEDSIFDLRRKGPDLYDLYRQGILYLKDLPDELLSLHQRIQVEGTRNQKDFLRLEAVSDFLGSLRYPLCFLDFETFSLPIPPFDGTWPYQKIPFQYSLHCLRKEGAPLEHYEFLAPPHTDPREGLLRKLMGEIPEGACTLVYSRSFEEGVLRELGEAFPEHSKWVERIIDGMEDLMVPFQRKDLYLWQMRGSYSIKSVLPAMVPELTYSDLEIQEGEMASQAYLQLCSSEDPAEREQIRKALLEYCCLDTLGMVRIVERMRQLRGTGKERERL